MIFIGFGESAARIAGFTSAISAGNRVRSPDSSTPYWRCNRETLSLVSPRGFGVQLIGVLQLVVISSSNKSKAKLFNSSRRAWEIFPGFSDIYSRCSNRGLLHPDNQTDQVCGIG